MEIVPILSAMRRNKTGAILIASQMAMTLAILCNALFIVHQHLAWSQRLTGADEANILAVTNQWVGKPQDLKARAQTDLAALRTLADVIDAFATNTFPLANKGWSDFVNLKLDQQHSSAPAALYFADEHAIHTLGLRLIAGRDFTAADIIDGDSSFDSARPSSVIVTRALAERLFPGEKALGKTVYVSLGTHSTQIVGIVDKLQAPWTSPTSGSDYSMLEPIRVAAQESFYIVRVQPRSVASVLHAVRDKLVEIDRGRLIEVSPLSSVRADAYRDDRVFSSILAVVCIVSLTVTALGILGLTSYWVAQRRQQIGIRRALGATRTAIVRYFQTENFLIASVGATVGVMLAIGVNLWMVSAFELERLQFRYTILGAVIVLLLGQGAALWPALRAALISPAEATRGI